MKSIDVPKYLYANSDDAAEQLEFESRRALTIALEEMEKEPLRPAFNDEWYLFFSV